MDLDPQMLATFGVGLLAYTLVFSSLFLARYAIEGFEREVRLRNASLITADGVEG